MSSRWNERSNNSTAVIQMSLYYAGYTPGRGECENRKPCDTDYRAWTSAQCSMFGQYIHRTGVNAMEKWFWVSAPS